MTPLKGGQRCLTKADGSVSISFAEPGAMRWPGLRLPGGKGMIASVLHLRTTPLAGFLSFVGTRSFKEVK
jgi:hypothetical protein